MSPALSRCKRNLNFTQTKPAPSQQPRARVTPPIPIAPRSRTVPETPSCRSRTPRPRHCCNATTAARGTASTHHRQMSHVNTAPAARNAAKRERARPPTLKRALLARGTLLRRRPARFRSLRRLRRSLRRRAGTIRPVLCRLRRRLHTHPTKLQPKPLTQRNRRVRAHRQILVQESADEVQPHPATFAHANPPERTRLRRESTIIPRTHSQQLATNLIACLAPFRSRWLCSSHGESVPIPTALASPPNNSSASSRRAPRPSIPY